MIQAMAIGTSLLVDSTPAHADDTCEPILSVDLLRKASTQFVIVGERHGTAQIPHFFGELVCRFTQDGPVIVGLEIDADEQDNLDRFLASDGGPDAVAALISSQHWTLNDGRASQAMLDLVVRLHELRAHGRDIEILAFMLPADSREGREQVMAEAMMDAAEARPEARVLSLIGKVHAERTSLGGLDPAASYLPEDRTLTLSYVPWQLCRRRSQCGAFQREPRYRIVANPPAEWQWPVYDYWYAVAEPFAPSGLVLQSQPLTRTP